MPRHGGVHIDLEDGDFELLICGKDATDISPASGQGDVQKRVIARFARGYRRAVCDDVFVGDDLPLLGAAADLHGLRVVKDEGSELLVGGDAADVNDAGDGFVDGVRDGVEEGGPSGRAGWRGKEESQRLALGLVARRTRDGKGSAWRRQERGVGQWL